MSALDDLDPFDLGLSGDDALLALGERLERQAQAAAAAMALAEATEAADPARPVPFLRTSTAARIFEVIERCAHMKRNGLVIGAPGIGKTMALREAERRAENHQGPNVAVIKVHPAYGGSLMALFEELAPLLNVRPAHSVTATVRRIVREASFQPLVLFDEAQNLSLRIVHQLLAISEDADVRMVFVGNPETVHLVNSQMADVRLISRRLPYRDTIDGITDDDTDLVCTHFAVEGIGGYRICREVGAVFHMDGVVEVLREAKRQAGEAKTLRPTVIQSALAAFPQFVAGLAAAETRPAALRQRTAPARLARA